MIVTRIRRIPITLAGTSFALVAAWQSSSALAANDTWQVTVGDGVISSPEYPGAADNKTQAVPLVSATYGRYFVGAVPGTGEPARSVPTIASRRTGTRSARDLG